ncbi:hypothetical protein LEMLEM_LOCUS6953 [Lemmus lemmus]
MRVLLDQTGPLCGWRCPLQTLVQVSGELPEPLLPPDFTCLFLVFNTRCFPQCLCPLPGGGSSLPGGLQSLEAVSLLMVEQSYSCHQLQVLLPDFRDSRSLYSIHKSLDATPDPTSSAHSICCVPHSLT